MKIKKRRRRRRRTECGHRSFVRVYSIKRPPSDRWETANGGGESLSPSLSYMIIRLFSSSPFVCVRLNKRKCLLMDDVMTASKREGAA